MNSNNEYEQEIDLKDLMFSVLRKWRMIIVAAVFFAVLLGGIKLFGGMRQLNDEEYIAENRQTYEDSMELYNTSKERLEREIENIQDSIEEQQEYKNKSILMNINPYDVYTETTSFYISTDYTIMPGMVYQNPNTATSILKAYLTIAQNGEMYNYVLERMENALSLRYLKELVTVEADYDNSMLEIKVVGETEEQAGSMMKYIKDCINDSKGVIEQAIGTHELSIVDESKFVTVDLELEQKQKDFSASMEQLDQSLQTKNDELKALEEPQDSLLSKTSVLKSAIKYGVLGGVLGAFVVVFFVCVAFLMSDKLVNEKELRRRYQIAVLGVFGRKEKGVFAFVNRWLNKLENSAAEEMSESQVYEVAAANALNYMDGERELLLIGTVDSVMLEKVQQGLTGLLEGVVLSVGGDLSRDAQAIRRVSACDGVIIVEARNSSGFSAIEKELEVVRSLNKKIVGCIIF